MFASSHNPQGTHSSQNSGCVRSKLQLTSQRNSVFPYFQGSSQRVAILSPQADFDRLCWYVGEKYLRDRRAKEDFPSRILESIEVLADFLVSEVRTMERGLESVRRDVRDQVPNDKVKDAPAVARELRWRV